MESFLDFTFGIENKLLVDMIAIEEYLGLQVGSADHDDDPILQCHRQFHFISLFADDVHVALHNYVMGGFHVYIVGAGYCRIAY